MHTVLTDVAMAFCALALAWQGVRRIRRRKAVQKLEKRCLDMLVRPGESFQPDIICAQALNELITSGRRAAAVTVGSKFIGVLRLGDFAKLRDRDLDFVYVGAIMTPAERVLALAPETPAGEALRRLTESGCQELPVLSKGGALLGFVSREAVR